jgi:hypothetical protein
VDQHRKETAYGLLAVATLALIPAYLGLLSSQRTEYWPVGIATALLSGVAVVAAVWLLAGDPLQKSTPDETRIMVLVLGGLCGLLMSWGALVQGWHWRAVFFGGLEKWQGEDWWKIWVCVAFLLLGLVLMFASFLLARTAERSNAILRRLLYGYNAVLTGLLLFAVLLVLNLLVYAFQERGLISPVYDCTASSLYTLSPRSQNILEQLDKPVTVYVVLPDNDRVYSDVSTLLNNCRNVTDKLKVEYIDPHKQPRRLAEVRKEHPFNELGLLLVYGTGPGAPSDFVSARELSSREPPREPGQRNAKDTVIFKGEDALMTRLNTLTEEKPLSPSLMERLKKPAKVYAIFAGNDPLYKRLQPALEQAKDSNKELEVEPLSPDTNAKQIEELRNAYKFTERTGLLFVYPRGARPAFEFVGPNQLFQKWVVYFTQGNGELELDDPDISVPDRGLAELKRRLELAGYEVRGLQLVSGSGGKSPNPQLEVSDRVPDNAGVVVIARPQRPFAPHAVTALREYMNRQAAGKKKGKLVLLLDVVASKDKRMERTGLEEFLLEFGVEVGNAEVVNLDEDLPPQIVEVVANRQSVNPVRPLLQRIGRFFEVRQLQVRNPPPSTGYMIDVLAQTRPNSAAIQTDLGRVAQRVVDRPSEEPIPFAIAVSERSPGGEGKAEPRVLVFGDATFVSNVFMMERQSDIFFDLFSSGLGWLRERPGNIGIAPKRTEMYSLEPSASAMGLIWLPALLSFLGIIGLGAGIWVVRRR